MTRLIATLGVVLLLLTDAAHSQHDEVASAVSYCRDRIQAIQLRDLVSVRSSPGAYLHLNDDQTIFCFDGQIHLNQDTTAVRNLKANGSFVIRSPGGYAEPAIEIANVLREKNAVVVLYDYCLSACANYIFFASGQTYVAKNTVVAWHGGPQEWDCDFVDRVRVFSESKDLPTWTKDQMDRACKEAELQRGFFQMRGTDGAIVHAPQSRHTDKVLKLSAQFSGYRDRNIFWMWHPRHYEGRFKTQIIHEAYPGSQEEIDAIMRKFPWPYGRVIYDP